MGTMKHVCRMKLNFGVEARMSSALPSPPGEGGLAEAIAERGRVGRSLVVKHLPTRPLRGHPPLAGRDGTTDVATNAVMSGRKP